jgi:S1-C subfamily serine protease
MGLQRRLHGLILESIWENYRVTSPFTGLEVDEALRPSERTFGFNLDRCLSSLVALEARIPPDAFTAETLGVQRLGNGVVISEDGLVATIGYLITEAEEVVLTTGDGRRIEGHVLGIDANTGFGLISALEPLKLPAMPIGDSRLLGPDAPVIIAGGGGQAHAVAGQVLARASFAGYWEYLLDEALFTAPAHPHWSGAALIGPSGDLLGIGSLRMDQTSQGGKTTPINMCVPAELLPPILENLTRGRPANPPRPWIGVFAQDLGAEVMVVDVAASGPAARAELRRGDIILAVGGHPLAGLGDFYQRLWALGTPGVHVPLTLRREREVFEVELRSADRGALLKKRRFN